MFPFPKVDDCTIFPLPESTNLEFKLSFTSSMSDKIISTICGILNSGGGYIIIGIEDETRHIAGIKTDKSLDNFLLMLDSIYHHRHIKKVDGSSVPLGTIKTGIVQAAEGKELLVVTLTAEPDEKYTVKDGTIWYRLAASNFKQTAMPVIYTEKEHDVILRKKLASQANMLHQQFDIEKRLINQKFQAEREILRKKFRDVEYDFQQIVCAAKDSEQRFSEFRNMLYTNIQLQKAEVEKELYLEKKNNSWLSLFCCF